MKKKLIALLMALTLTLALVGCGGGNEGADKEKAAGGSEKVVIKVAYENNPGEPIDKAVREWGKLAAEKSNGKIEMQFFPSSQLGSKTDLVEQMKMGSNVITLTDGSFLMDMVPDFGILSGPYLTDNVEQLIALTETEWFADLGKQLEAEGLHIVTTNWNYGTRITTTKKPISTPEDMKGQKIRVPNNPLMIEIFKAMGATPTPLAWGETYTAMTQGVVDGAENPAAVLYGQKMHEVTNSVSLTNHINMIAQWVAGQKFWETLPEDVQQALVEAGNEAGLINNEEVAAQEKTVIAEMEKAGATITEVDVEAFREATRVVYDKFPEWTPGLYDTVQALLAEQQ